MITTHRARRRRGSALAAAGLAIATLLAAACGDDDDDGAGDTAGGTPAVTAGDTTGTTTGDTTGTTTGETTGDTTGTTTGDTGGTPTTGAAGGEEPGIDDGSTITMWTRAATEAQSQRFVDAYNESHENQVELTVIPTDDYLPRVGTAAGAGELPDVVSLVVLAQRPGFNHGGTTPSSRIKEIHFFDGVD